jgi:hypothetical protein
MTIQELIKQKESTYKYFTENESLKAVEQNGYALQYVKETLFKKEPKELTINDISELLGYEIKIIK